ncbi:hypothetical protein CDFC105_31417 [Clostridioides difficile]|nr:hypothetical protein CDFC105_31417 [Clostridioides difficile]
MCVAAWSAGACDELVCFVCKRHGAHRDLHVRSRRQRQMCIRDSRYAEALFQLGEEENSTDVLFKELEKVVDMMTKAVSYTHLRAHETPEHLVCRLLLEKKKQTHTSKSKIV